MPGDPFLRWCWRYLLFAVGGWLLPIFGVVEHGSLLHALCVLPLGLAILAVFVGTVLVSVALVWAAAQSMDARSRR